MYLRETWAVSTGRIIEFFERQADAEVTAEGIRCRNCRITLTELPSRELGPIEIPRTLVEMSGDDTEQIYRRFFFRFISAGG